MGAGTRCPGTLAVVPASRLPLIDRHATSVAAPPEAVWDAVGDALVAGFSARTGALYARAVGCTDTRSSEAGPLHEGATIPGFHVTGAEPGRRLALEGRHRFSVYALVFTLEPADGGTRLTAESRAVFPGLGGRLYRAALLRTGGHVFAVRRLLQGVRRRAEERAPLVRS
jgi:hypothetical protein